MFVATQTYGAISQAMAKVIKPTDGCSYVRDSSRRGDRARSLKIDVYPAERPTL